MSIKDIIHQHINSTCPSHEGICDICNKKKQVRDYAVRTPNDYLMVESETLCNKCADKLLNNNFLITYLPKE